MVSDQGCSWSVYLPPPFRSVCHLNDLPMVSSLYQGQYSHTGAITQTDRQHHSTNLDYWQHKRIPDARTNIDDVIVVLFYDPVRHHRHQILFWWKFLDVDRLVLLSWVFSLVLCRRFYLESCSVVALRSWLLPPVCSGVFHTDSPPKLTSFSPPQGPTRSGLG